MKRYPFPGNIREFKNVIERAVYRDTTDEISSSDLGLASPKAIAAQSGSYQEQLDAFAHELIADAMQAAVNNQAEAARRLGLTYHQFRHYFRKHHR